MSSQPFRLATGGRIDRQRALCFRFDGQVYWGHPGDTLASALLANGVRLVGRSFKYHRPRGILAAGVEEPNALVRLGEGARAEPNTRATQVELFDGLVAESQNRWPSLAFDAGQAGDLLSALLPVGFYYKTFMRPKGWWERYERLIRQAAGMGRAPQGADPDRYAKMHAHCDVLVVGAGPAGIAAALAAGQRGARVVLADEQAELGGGLLAAASLIDGQSAGDWLALALATLRAMDQVRLLPRTTAFGYYDHNFLGLVERVSDHLAAPPAHLPRHRLWKLRARQVVLATGALERPLVFADNDRPGVMLAGAAATYATRYGVRSGKRAVLFTNNSEAYGAAIALADAGVQLTAIVDAREDVRDDWAARARERGIRLLAGQAVVAVEGRRQVAGVRAMRLGPGADQVTGLPARLECDLLMMSGGYSPTLHLYAQSGGRLVWDPLRACQLPGEARQAVHVAGAARGSLELAQALVEGTAAGAQAAAECGFAGALPEAPQAEPAPAAASLRPLWLVPLSQSSGGKRFVDLQNDVTAADLMLATREGYRAIEHVKRYTTAGLGTDQGKTGNINTLAIVAQKLSADIAGLGHTTYRPPYTPVSFAALAGQDRAPLHEPVRRTGMQGWHEERGAEFEPVGQWRRPHHYPRPGESMHEAVARECLAVRQAVGVVDASTLGKIDIQGPDSPKVLNWVYTNAWDRLPIGRCRYGLMLNEEGMVFDDGVTARLDQHHFHMTTTSGGASTVMNWLEEWLQTEWLNWRVRFTSVTEQWAVAAIAGPSSRALLKDLAENLDLSDEALPFMGVSEGRVAGLPARVFRIGYTGAQSYEINVAASHGMALWLALLAAGEKYGITPFGTEAMHVLRAEVGFIAVGHETDGTVTPDDLGLARLCKTSQDFLGRRGLARPALRAERKQLVGLLTDHPKTVLPMGGQVIDRAELRPPHPSLGHVTSSYWSAHLGRSIALALIKGGRARQGERVWVTNDGGLAPATIAPARFLAPAEAAR
ncbi:MAG: sarcosine oxidase subunit alpha family protein [Alphaproteobacteria bacterium]|nr:sarcosine oxidase subunit alpha family protein [Alphaproteobacteria bacterium]